MTGRLSPTWMHDEHTAGVGTLAELAPGDPRIDRLSGALAAAGVDRGDLVAWQLPNGEDAVLLLWACWRLGAVAAPQHHRATPAEVERLLAGLPVRLVVERGEVERLIAGAAPWHGPPPAPTDLALLLHTSGSSGAPKAVLHTQATLAHKARTMVGVHGLSADDAVLMPAPLAHISGIMNGLTVPAAAGMRTVLMDRWDPELAIELIESDRVTFMVGPPTFFLGLRDAGGFDPSRLRSLRLVSLGGTGVTPELCAELADTFGAVVKRAYGSTEAPTVTTSWVGDPEERRCSTDGRSTGSARLRIGDAGELQVRGPELFVGYADAAGNAAAITEDGWFRTGDTAVLDDGWVTITGRLDDLVIRGGENVAPAEVEAVLCAHPDVVRAVVVGITDERLGERVCAVAELRPGASFDLEACRAWCERRGLARFKWPERIVEVPAIPLLLSGKPDRSAVRRLADGA